MINILNKFLNKTEQKSEQEYLCCRHLQGGITFMNHAFRTCCSNKQGVTFVDNYQGNKIDWKQIAKVRKQIIDDCKKGILPYNCRECIDLEKKIWNNDNLIDNIYINHWDHCNCGCIYCVSSIHTQFLETQLKPSRYYNVYNHLKEMYKHKMISPKVHVEFVGGEIAVLDEADKTIELCLKNGVGEMSFHSSMVYYSNGIERAFKEAPSVNCDFSLDCANRELYKKIKRIDAFDDVINNLKKYINCTDKAADYLTAKYIIVDDFNDNIDELDKWIELIYSLGIKNLRVDVNFKRFFSEFNHKDPTVPKHYYAIYEHFKKRVDELGLNDCCWEFPKRVLKEGGIPKGYI